MAKNTADKIVVVVFVESRHFLRAAAARLEWSSFYGFFLNHKKAGTEGGIAAQIKKPPQKIEAVPFVVNTRILVHDR